VVGRNGGCVEYRLCVFSMKEGNPNSHSHVPTFSKHQLTNIVKSEAVGQVERRIHLVDGILDLGFRTESEYSITMYVPMIQNGHIPRLQPKKIKILQRDISKTVTNLKNDLSEMDVDWLMSIVTLD
jgi:hypothetical protein